MYPPEIVAKACFYFGVNWVKSNGQHRDLSSELNELDKGPRLNRDLQRPVRRMRELADNVDKELWAYEKNACGLDERDRATRFSLGYLKKFLAAHTLKNAVQQRQTRSAVTPQ
jgi:hypothetical protein